MAYLKVYDSSKPSEFVAYEDRLSVKNELDKVGIKIDFWQPSIALTHDATETEILSAYQEPIKKLKDEFGFKSSDVVSLTKNHPDKDKLREKFLSEHIHSDDEARYFIDGKGLFYVHEEDKVYGIICKKGDLINIPRGTRHWFDMGSEPNFKCIRVFTNEEGWVAEHTGSNISQLFPMLEP